jgi:dephospho-CoA kinase
MIKVGITGGIGSGKSLVCEVFSRLGAPVYYADERARFLMEHDTGIRKDLTAVLGDDIYTGKALNRQRIAGLIFNNPELLIRVNQIIHPRVAVDFEDWCSRLASAPVAIHESALLFEAGMNVLFDYIVLVTAPAEIRIGRVAGRPGMTPEKIQRIMNNQLPDEEKIVRSHFVLKNDGLTLLLPAILLIYTELMNK